VTAATAAVELQRLHWQFLWLSVSGLLMPVGGRGGGGGHGHSGGAGWTWNGSGYRVSEGSVEFKTPLSGLGLCSVKTRTRLHYVSRMTKRRRSKSANRKKARVGPEYSYHTPSAGPSLVSEEQMQVGSPVPADDLDIASMDISPSARLFSLDLPSRVKRYMEQRSRSKDYTALHAYIDGLHLDNDAPQNIVSLDVFKQNVTRKNASDFRNLVNKAVTEKDWENVVTHGMCLALSS
jgi:hypothetical protein